MISEAIRLIADELGAYVELNDTAGFTSQESMLLANVADLEQDETGRLRNRVLLSLVNVEEESTLKNAKHFARNHLNGGIEYRELPVHVNLYLLFCATYDTTNVDAYEHALRRLSLVITFFQSKRVFTIQNSPNSSVAKSEMDAEEKNQIRLILDFYTLTFEQINHLWGSLGGKQVPFTMYKARLVKLEDKISREGAIIEQVQAPVKINTANP